MIRNIFKQINSRQQMRDIVKLREKFQTSEQRESFIKLFLDARREAPLIKIYKILMYMNPMLRKFMGG